MLRRYVLALVAVVALCLIAPAAFAQANAAPPTATQGSLFVITSGIAYAIAVAGCGLAQGKATTAACESLARNPGAAGAIRLALILGLVFIESLTLYMFAVLYLKL